jgi:flavodoxin
VFSAIPFLFAAVIALLPGCSKAQQLPAQARPQTAGEQVLIVYLSRTANTKTVAEIIRDKVGGTMVALEPERPYPADYDAIVEQVARENETGYLPPLKTKIDRIEQYRVVFLGFPTWGMRLPPPMKSFLRENDLRGKTVVPFNTNGGYGGGSSFETFRDLCRGCTVLDGFSTRGGLERDGVLLAIQGSRAKEAEAEVESWLRRIEVLR